MSLFIEEERRGVSERHTACPAGRVVEALQSHGGGINSVGTGLDVIGRLVIITTTFIDLIGKIRHLIDKPESLGCRGYWCWFGGG